MPHELEEYPKVSCPLLAIWGAGDDMMPPHRSAVFLEECLARAGHEDATFRIVPGASHILTRAGEKDRFVKGYPALLTDWLARRFDFGDAD